MGSSSLVSPNNMAVTLIEPQYYNHPNENEAQKTKHLYA
jgi:hypothetical protein